MSKEDEPIDWETALVYVAGLICILLVLAALVYGFFYLYSYCYDSDEQRGRANEQKRARGTRATRRSESMGNKSSRSQTDAKKLTEGSMASEKVQGQPGEQARELAKGSESVSAMGKQTMLSTLYRTADSSDVVLATAVSAIPLKELGPGNDIYIDVGQQMYFNKDELEKDERRCIVCRDRKEIAWKTVSCYAQTTIGVLVCKRTLAEEKLESAKSESTGSLSTDLDGNRLPVKRQSQQQQQQQKQKQQKLEPKVGPFTLADLSSVTPRTSSTIPLAPTPDSRLELNPKLEKANRRLAGAAEGAASGAQKSRPTSVGASQRNLQPTTSSRKPG